MSSIGLTSDVSFYVSLHNKYLIWLHLALPPHNGFFDKGHFLLYPCWPLWGGLTVWQFLASGLWLAEIKVKQKGGKL